MKKFLRTGKKALSVFMAVMMVMTAWVFFEPMEAEAAAGSYTVKVIINVTNKADNQGSIQSSYFEVSYRPNNGTSAVSTSKVTYDLRANWTSCLNSTGTKTITINNVPGFPTSLYAYNDAVWNDKVDFSITKITVGGPTATKDAWTGSQSMNSGGVGNSETTATLTLSAPYPYANSMSVSASSTSVTAPSTSGATAVTSKVTASATDQYGVTMFDPTWSISSNNSNGKGFSLSTTASAASTTASITYLANMAGTTDSQTLTVTATWSTPSSSTYSSRSKTATITVNDASYTAKFTGLKDSNGNAIADVTRTAQKYGHTPTAATTASSYSIGDYDYSFTGWSPALGQITANTTYTAQYSSTFVAANLTELQAKIAVANQAKASSTWTTNGYTTGSMNNLNTALTAANNLNKSTTGRTQQSAVDSAAQALQDAIDALELVTHTVKFYDVSGAIISVQEIVHEQGATAPTNNPTKDDDEAYHYTWKGWDTAYNSVITDLEIHPTYNSVAHSWGTATTTAANCQHGVGTTKTCTVCGRVSYSYDDTLGDHNKSTSYVIDTQPTCTAKGSGHYYCTICNANLETVTIPAKGHSYAVTVTKEATCTQTGTREIKCTVCGDKTTETIPLKQHN